MASRYICPVCGWDESRDLSRTSALCRIKKENWTEQWAPVSRTQWDQLLEELEASRRRQWELAEERTNLKLENILLRDQLELLQRRLDETQPASPQPVDALWVFDKATGSLRPKGDAVLPKLLVVPPVWEETAVRQLDSWAFQGRTELRKVILPQGLTSIGAYCFMGCENLVSIKLPTTLTQLGDNAFNRCTRLKAIEIPEGVEVLSSGTFMNCAKLAHVTLPATLSQIGASAFAKCGSLTEFFFPDSVREINLDAFLGCRSLKRISLLHFWKWRGSELHMARIPADCQIEYR